MENQSVLSGTTNSTLDLGAIVFMVIAVLILLWHELRVIMVRNEKERYDYVNANEIRYFWYSVMAFIVAADLFLNNLLAPLIPLDPSMMIYVRVFFFVGFGVVAYMLLASAVRIMYPRVIERRLARIRNKPRISPQGNVMRKLSEEEEAVHLDQSQVEEQASDIHSVEYDVWIDEKTGYKLVEKYMASQHALKCAECGFYTMKIHSEEIEKRPTATEEGLLLEHYRCSYCKHRERKEVVIAKLSSNT